MATTILYLIDAFTDVPFSGNPAAVCVLDAAADDVWMQLVAREMNLSETAFLHPIEAGWSLRWFTPSVEVKLCGHATLASAFTLWETSVLATHEEARFNTLSGELICRRRDNWIEMDFPAANIRTANPPRKLVEGLGVQVVAVADAGIHWLLELDSEAAVRSVRPNFQKLSGLPVQGIIVTALSQKPEFDFVSRYFAPSSGVNEDPVTGSAHCALGPYWQSRLGRSEFTAYQASVRGGIVKVRVLEDRVLLGGQAVMMGKVELGKRT